jgi:hypothetical protein
MDFGNTRILTNYAQKSSQTMYPNNTHLPQGPLHTRLWEPIPSTLQALSLVEKAELVQVRFTLHLRAQQSMWMQDGYNVYMDPYRGIKWIMFHYHLDYFPKPPLGGRHNTKPGDHGIPNTHNCWIILLCHVWKPARIKTHSTSIWLRARSLMASHYTRGSVTALLHDVGGV